jgi:Flp pilus assembly pilin Flp
MIILRDARWRALARRLGSKSGQGFVEYILIVAVVGILMASALVAFQVQVGTALDTIASGFASD